MEDFWVWEEDVWLNIFFVVLVIFGLECLLNLFLKKDFVFVFDLLCEVKVNELDEIFLIMRLNYFIDKGYERIML